MKPCALFLVLICGVALIGGCSVTIGTGGHGQPHGHPSPHEDVTISEIDAAASLAFDNAKEKSFKNIASRPALSGNSQSYLIDKAMRSLSFDNAKEGVMLTLIANPDFLAEGKRAILDNLNRLSFDNAKERVLDALNRRGYVPSGDIQNPVETETTVEVEVGYGTG